MNRKKKSILALLIAIAAAVTLGWLGFVRSPARQEFTDGVILVPVSYTEGRWFLGDEGILVLPCEAGSEIERGEKTGPLVRVLGPEGEVLYSQALPMDPRYVLYEGPTEESNLLERVSITLKVPLLEGASRLEYYLERNEDGSVEKKQPVLEVDLTDAVGAYYQRGGPEETAPCQQPAYPADALGKRYLLDD